VAPIAATASGCDDPSPNRPDAGSGTGGEGGCPVAPEPQFRLTIHTVADTPVPSDTRLTVAWSAGNQVFDLDDPSTWKSLEEGNVVCAVDKDAGPPDDLAALVCHLWTTGATEIEVAAVGYQPLQQTLQPAEIEDCDTVPSSDVDVALEPMADAGR
jgi:hypothetical protein